MANTLFQTIEDLERFALACHGSELGAVLKRAASDVRAAHSACLEESVVFPWDEGYEAGCAGRSALECPYPAWEVDAESWISGWRDGMSHRSGGRRGKASARSVPASAG